MIRFASKKFCYDYRAIERFKGQDRGLEEVSLTMIIKSIRSKRKKNAPFNRISGMIRRRQKKS
jgi:hypothetical protein